MLLVIDVGNSEATVGLFDGDRLAARGRLTTAVRTPDEWATSLGSVVVRSQGSPSAACIASVVPDVTHALVEGARAMVGTRVGVLDARVAVPLVLDVDEPLAVGADRIAGCLGALDRHPGDSIVITFGTATTFNCVSADRRFFGGSIMPGLRTSADQLIRRAARLSATELIPPTRVIGRSTEDNVRGGVLFGAADAADGMVVRIRAEWPGGSAPRVIATGGLSSVVAPLMRSVDVVDGDLTLHGLRVAATSLRLLP